MFLSEFSIKRPVAMIVIIIGLMALGLLALTKLRVNQIPDVEQPVLVVNIAYPGASPDTVEREIINRIEKAMQGLSGVDQVRSTASEGNARLVLIFNFNKNMIEAADEVRNSIGTVRHKLPIEMREPVLTRLDPSAQPSCNWRCHRKRKATPRSRAWPKTSSPTSFAPSTAWPWSASAAHCGAN